jgi:predicted small metal-binding protein
MDWRHNCLDPGCSIFALNATRDYDASVRTLHSDIQTKNSSEEINMAKTISCRDVGMDCDFVAKGETTEDIMQQAAEHARTAYNMTEIPPEVADKVRGAIRDEAA